MVISLKGKRKWWLILVPVLAAAMLVFTGGRGAALPGGSDMERRQFLEGFGWELGEAYLRETIRIPAVFDKVYQTYNQIQLDQGVDLQKYAGKEVERCQYIVTNYPNYPEGIRANLLIFEGKIIGGDVCSIALGGFMHGFSHKSSDNERESDKSDGNIGIIRENH